MFKKIAILGMGLMGGSLALALRKKRPNVCTSVYARRLETREEIVKRHIADEVFDNPASAVKGADIIVICVPVTAIPTLLKEAVPCIKKNALITDVGSTKKWLLKEMRKIVPSFSSQIVGSHPIAGSEMAGLSAAREDLYDNAVVIVTEDGIASKAAINHICHFWKLVGAKTEVLSAEEHDKIIAATSHLPHIVASLLADVVFNRSGLKKMHNKKIALYCGKGIKDTTRIALGDVTMWMDIIRTNRSNILFFLNKFRKAVLFIENALRRCDTVAVKKVLCCGQQGRLKIKGEPDGNG